MTPRRGLPSSRAVVGGLLVALAALGTYRGYQGANGLPSTSFVVAAADVDPGDRLAASSLRLEAISLPDGVAEHAYTSVGELEGSVAIAPLRQGELVPRSAVVPAGGGETAASPPVHEFSFLVERSRAVNGTLSRGERVDVLATYGTGDTARTQVVVRNALVTEIDNDSTETIGSASTITLTLAIPTADDVLRTAHATLVAEITLVRATKADDDGTLDHYDGPTP